MTDDTSEDFALAMQLQYEEERLYQISHAKDHGSTKCRPYSAPSAVVIFDRPNTYGVVFPLDASPSVKVDKEVRKHYVGVNSHYSGNMSDGTVVHPTVGVLAPVHRSNRQSTTSTSSGR